MLIINMKNYNTKTKNDGTLISPQDKLDAFDINAHNNVITKFTAVC